MITITKRQAEKLSKRIDDVLGRPYTVSQLQDAFNRLADALNSGTVLASGDGFYYWLTRRNGLLKCQDGGILKGSLYTALTQYVWTERDYLPLFADLAECITEASCTNDNYDEVESAAEASYVLDSYGFG